jgi:hypothetical protein
LFTDIRLSIFETNNERRTTKDEQLKTSNEQR